jgi:hypothetical protein
MIWLSLQLLALLELLLMPRQLVFYIKNNKSANGADGIAVQFHSMCVIMSIRAPTRLYPNCV